MMKSCVLCEYWKKRTGRLPQELIFDSKLTTYGNLSQLNQQDILFITLRRRSQQMLDEVLPGPASAWRQIHLEGVSRIYRDPRILDQRIKLTDYEKPIRQLWSRIWDTKNPLSYSPIN